MRLWIVGIAAVCIIGFMISDVGIIESNTLPAAPVMNNEPLAYTQTPSTSEPSIPSAEQNMKHHMTRVSNQYEQNIRFPHYSIPIDSGQTDLLEPLKVYPVSLKPEKDEDATVTLTPEQFSYQQGDIIKATFSYSGNITATQIGIELVENNNTLTSFKIRKEGSDVFAELDSANKDWPVDLHIKATFNFGKHGRLMLLSPIKYSPDNGTIVGIGDAYVDGANLSIPVELDIKKAGRYRLTANLFNEDKSPIAHLSAKQNLKEGDNTWVLQVHSEVLRSVNNPGPYLLDTWTLTKLPERPGIRTSYGSSAINEQTIEGFDLSQYDNTPWEDPQDKARLEFLKKL